MLLHGLLAWFREHPQYQNLRDELRAGLELPSQSLLPTAIPPTFAALSEDLAVPLLIVTPTTSESRRLTQALQGAWLAQPERLLTFPPPPVLPYERAPWTPETISDRLRVLATLFLWRVGAAGTAPPLIITSVRALLRRPLPYRQFRRAARKIERGMYIPLAGLARHCRGSGYETVSVVEAPGQISRRGGILDIFPPQAPHPYRLDFFGDKLDVIRIFDPTTQRSTGRVASFWLMPVREALPRDGERALPALRAHLERDLPPELHGPFTEDMQSLEAGVPFPTLEFYLPLLYQESSTLVDYLPPDAQIILYNTEALSQRWTELEAETQETRRRALEEQTLLPDTAPPYVSWESWQATLKGRRVLTFSPGEASPFAAAFAPEPHFAGRLEEALGHLRQWVGLGDQVVVVSRQAARLAELWQEFTPPPVHEKLAEPPETLITFVQGSAPGGWQLSRPHLTRHLITDEELFGWRPPEPRRRPRRRVTTPELPCADLQPGSAVVHEDYGIGIFQGLALCTIDDVEREYLMLEYANSDRLYVPIHQADRLTPYVGPEGLGPRLSRLGSAEWATAKARVRQATEELARELLDLYAARQLVAGHAFAPDTSWQAELEAAFPYVETEDQAAAVEAVKKDMEQPRPMDRLICGDAGYGKTEVALRAAFKAVMDSQQVAMLVPTTVLAQQHFLTFRQRLESFPVTVEVLSRFRTASEQRQVLAGMAEGQVDIVIGTHRLLQKDVHFKNLGLVIIDEEQRFGVRHKEQLKRIRMEGSGAHPSLAATGVDVLTLTATPIPRTLYMGLTGVRDISIIETPPQERLPLSTYIGPYDSNVVRRAILREMRRSGQVFYVHNRVGSIRVVETRLQQLLPGARIGVAHGQMRERDLARVMEQFAAGEIDVLVATTIIESGLDFPNANTIIVERADRFGLAQLYQLRGRIGRGTRRGYAYLFHGRRMKEEARARLQALREAVSSGGGFAIALRDLELRGAGDLLGAKQHGHIAAVGFTLYTRLLARTVARLKAERAGEAPPPEPLGSITIELPLAVGLPEDYVPDDRLRLQLYRRLAELTTVEEITQLAEELQDRFGPLPPLAQNLLAQLHLKVLARDAHVPAITVASGQIVLRLPGLKDMDAARRAALRRAVKGRARLGNRELWLPISWEQTRWRENLRAVLETLADFVTRSETSHS